MTAGMNDAAVDAGVPEQGRSAGSAAVLAQRVLLDLEPMLVRMGVAYRAEIAEYAALPIDAFTVDVLNVSRTLVITFLACVVADRPLAADEIAVFQRSGRQRLEMGMPLESVLHAYRIAGREAWTAICDAVQPGEDRLLGGLGARWIDMVDRVSTALAQAYLAASHERLRRLDARRRELVEALLTATEPSEVAAVSLRFSTVLAGSYVPVVVAGSTAAADIDVLLATSVTGTLGGHRGDRVLLLVPSTMVGPEPRPGALVAWGRPALCGPELLQEVSHVEDLVGAALSEGHTEGVFGPDDLLIEQLLLGNERVADALRRRVFEQLAARDSGNVLGTTLRTYLNCGSIPDTARSEHVHANTVGYRLSRVRDLTGLDPRVPRDAVLLVLGLGLPQESR